ncbi:2-hydroxyacid dehydrogenase [Rhodoligotrophos defluvii]|uniref:2-hydroxyacid dehydrogenase n=1 Tax=Rhodoligotrophos defluvii TaxID=2561934 RepID=UPI0010C984BF|nr:glyoxylate/hydroxypyruvate reductase A [Rhodoligotrophos defluvii]
MALLYVTSGWDTEAWAAGMAKLAPGRDVRAWPNCGNPDDIEYAFVWKPPHGVLKQFRNLKAIFCLGAGVDHILLDPDLPDVPVGRVVDPDLTMRMTEYVVFHVLLHHRQHLALAEAQKNRVWLASLEQPAACDVRVGVMGLGALGGDAAAKLRQIGFQVAGWSRMPKHLDGIETFSGQDGFKPFLNRTDILVCLLPHTADTTGLLNMDIFKALAHDGRLPGPSMINAGRGKIQIEADILAALDSGVLHSVSLDVFEHEPLDPDSPLWSHPRVVITPHNSADSDATALTGTLLAQLERFERDGVMENQVDPRRGY